MEWRENMFDKSALERRSGFDAVDAPNPDRNAQ
jgi:hypothetical protein